MKVRKICVITTSRADFGLLSGLIQEIEADPGLKLQVIVSGSHLGSEFGETRREIEKEGIRIDRAIDLKLEGISALSNVNAISRGLAGFGKAFKELKPEIVVLLGDRFELLGPVIAASMLGVPIAHIHGGELSEGAIDDSVRHAITKFASLHFPATEAYRQRIIQMGESPRRVFNFGAPGLDQLHRVAPIPRVELEKSLGISFDTPTALVTYHPVTRDSSPVRQQVDHLLVALKSCRLKAVFTMANADAQGSIINAQLQRACASNPGRFKWIPTLGHRRYLSSLRYFSLMVGNSSSGLTEAPSFRLPVVNIGDRQKGRVRAKNIIDVACTTAAIRKGIQKAMTPRFRSSLRGMRNPYDRYQDGRASKRIKDVLKTVRLSDDLLKKKFHDLL